MLILLPVNGIGQNIINNSRQNNKHDKKSAGFVKKVKREKAKNITAYFKIIPEPVIKSNEHGKEKNKEAIIEQKRILRIVKKLF